MEATKENYELRRQISLMLHYLHTGCKMQSALRRLKEEPDKWFPLESKPSWNWPCFEFEPNSEDAFFPIIGEEYEFFSLDADQTARNIFVGYDTQGWLVHADKEAGCVDSSMYCRPIKAKEPEPCEEKEPLSWHFCNRDKNLSFSI